MAITFTPTPSAGQTFTSGAKTWTWTGSVWKATPVISATSLSAFNTALPSGSILQTVQATNATYSALTTILPFDDTVPASSEGTSVLSQAITLASSSNRVGITVSLPMLAHGTAGAWLCYAIFRDTTCIDTGAWCNAGANYGWTVAMTYVDSPSVVSPTYSFRIGPAVAGNGYINGTAGSRYFGGTCVSILSLQEIKA